MYRSEKDSLSSKMVFQEHSSRKKVNNVRGKPSQLPNYREQKLLLSFSIDISFFSFFFAISISLLLSLLHALCPCIYHLSYAKGRYRSVSKKIVFLLNLQLLCICLNVHTFFYHFIVRFFNFNFLKLFAGFKPKHSKK